MYIVDRRIRDVAQGGILNLEQAPKKNLQFGGLLSGAFGWVARSKI